MCGDLHKELKEREKKTEKCEQITQQIIRPIDLDHTTHSSTVCNTCIRTHTGGDSQSRIC